MPEKSGSDRPQLQESSFVSFPPPQDRHENGSDVWTAAARAALERARQRYENGVAPRTPQSSTLFSDERTLDEHHGPLTRNHTFPQAPSTARQAKGCTLAASEVNKAQEEELGPSTQSRRISDSSEHVLDSDPKPLDHYHSFPLDPPDVVKAKEKIAAAKARAEDSLRRGHPKPSRGLSLPLVNGQRFESAPEYLKVRRDQASERVTHQGILTAPRRRQKVQKAAESARASPNHRSLCPLRKHDRRMSAALHVAVQRRGAVARLVVLKLTPPQYLCRKISAASAMSVCHTASANFTASTTRAVQPREPDLRE